MAGSKPGRHKSYPVKPLAEQKLSQLARAVRAAQQFVRDYPKTDKVGAA